MSVCKYIYLCVCVRVRVCVCVYGLPEELTLIRLFPYLT